MQIRHDGQDNRRTDARPKKLGRFKTPNQAKEFLLNRDKAFIIISNRF